MSWFRLSVVAVFLALGLDACSCARPPVQNTLKPEGEACAADEECESSLCDKLPGKSSVCFRKCAAGCKAGDICTALAVNDRFACVPERPGLCQPCALNVDCPYPGDRCLELGGTKVCARDCSFDGQCPSSYRCADGTDTNGAFATKQCQPTSGTCECTTATAGQTRPCSETNSIGTCTGVQTCKPPNGYDACSATVPSQEACNGRDDDCNGMTDENLGETTCGTGECRHTVSNCINGSPQTCEPLPAGTEVCDEKDNDCDGVADDGFDKNSLQHCGTCNTPCARPNATPVCATGTCSIGSCNPGFVNADGVDLNGCEYACTPTGMEVCDGVDNDCDTMIDEGFSTVTDPNNCGLCGRVCNVNNGHISTYACVASTCGIGTCATGFDDCDQNYGTGCERNVSSDVANCGACNNQCVIANGTAGCVSSACTVASCNVGWGNCNNQAADGCEQNTTGSVAHCGACNNVCPANANSTPTCAASMCGYTCNAGFVDLDGLAPNGCEYACTASGSDVPDMLFIDANCDGVDGDASKAIFVSPSGSDANPGTKALPKLTITAGVGAAATFTPRRSVFVATGLYAEAVTMQSGVSIYGGYNPSTWQRALTNVSHIQSPTRVGVSAANIALGVELQLMKVTAANATGQEANGDGRSSVGVSIVDSPAGVVLTSCDVTAGAGSLGLTGSTGTTGAAGSPGDPGGVGATAASGAGGASPCSSATGGRGGDGVSGTANGNVGGVGTQAPGGGNFGPAGSFGTGGICSTTDSSNGNDAPPVATGGSPGNPGGNASVPSQLGGVVSGAYVPASGLAGLTGLPGGGAGGGGSGGGTANGTNFFCTNCSNITSGGGGGGGGGGCGGTSGTPGRGGGGSFAVLVSNSNATVTNSTLRSGTGGNGGAGGNGGTGGDGGSGGSGSTGDARNNSCSNRKAGNGAQGGRGGDGGRGGGATGGAGGPSIGLSWSGTAPANTGNTFVTGSGGIGGNGGTNGLQTATKAPDGLVTQARSIP